MTIPKTTDPMRDEILDFVRKSEETITEAGRKLGKTVCELVPGEAQSIRKAVDEAFDFTETILKSQREFADSLLDKVLGVPSSRRAPAAKRPPANRPARQRPRRPRGASARPERHPVRHVGVLPGSWPGGSPGRYTQISGKSRIRGFAAGRGGETWQKACTRSSSL
jgi:hypothetical protein